MARIVPNGRFRESSPFPSYVARVTRLRTVNPDRSLTEQQRRREHSRRLDLGTIGTFDRWKCTRRVPHFGVSGVSVFFV